MLTKRTTRLIGTGVVLALVGGLTFVVGAGKVVDAQEAGKTASVPYTWQNVAIVGGGFVSGLITHPTEKGLMYARTDVGGAYRWDDKGKRWIPLTDQFGGPQWNYTGIESIAPDPTDPNKVYMAVGTYTNDWAGNGAILRSTDRGNTWKVTPLPFKNGGNMDGRSAGERLMVDPNQPSRILFGTRNEGLWQSDDSGATWKRSDSFPVKSRTNGIGTIFVVFDTKSGNKGKLTKTIYVGVSDKETGLYKSDDAGATWTTVPGQPKGFLPHHGVLTGTNSLYVTYGNAPGPNSMTDGAVWKLDTKSGSWMDVSPVKPGGDDKFGYAGLSVDGTHPDTLVVTTMDRWAKHDTIFRTLDGGKTWKDLGPKSERDSSLSPFLNWGREKADLGHWIGDIEIDPTDSNRVLYVTGATIWTSADLTNADKDTPTHWTVGAKGLEETVPLGLISPPSGPNLLSVHGDIGGYRHVDFDVSPPQADRFSPALGTTTGIDFAESSPNIIARVFHSDTGGAYSTDQGKTWTLFKTKAANSAAGTIAVSADGKTFVWKPERSSAFVSTDNGTTWKQSTGLTAPRYVVADRVKSNVFYAFENGTVYRSDDSGATFTAQATGLSNNGGDLKTVFGKWGDVWLPLEGGGLYHSTDSGKTFAKVLDITEAQRIGFGKSGDGRDYPAIYLVGTVNKIWGFYRSDDAGKTWVRINDDRHGFHYINVITGDPRVYGRVYLATGGRGIIVGETKPSK